VGLVRAVGEEKGDGGREVVPFKCEECGGEFAETQGGLCRSCSRLLCRKHLPIPLT
jgi:hypothetical protein